MKAKAIAVLICLFVLCAVAAAQDYHIVIKGRATLKDKPDKWYWNAIEIASKGAILHVVGEQGDWLKINRNGQEAWIQKNGPGVENYARIASSPQAHAVSQAPAVDNCCSLGWDCGTDQKKWEDGYNAYQRNDCHQDFVNCCRLGWTCRTYEDWEQGLTAFLLNNRSCPAQGQAQVSTQPITTNAGIGSGPLSSVSVTYPTNLRASYSLQSRILTTVAAGTTLGVSGSLGNWFKIDWSGREVWLANWVPMTRVEAGAVASDIDNCCSVNGECTTDQDWIEGYWAYQRNECLGPAPAQPHTGVPVQIEGSRFFVNLMSGAFDLLKTRAPTWYDYAIRGLNKIVQRPKGDDPLFAGAYVDCGGGKIMYSRRSDSYYGEYEGDIATQAIVVVHEACHCNENTLVEVICHEKEVLAAYEIDPDGSTKLPWLTRKHVGNLLREDPSLASHLQKPASYYTDY